MTTPDDTVLVPRNALQKAAESLVPPKCTETRLEYWKAGARAMLVAFNKVLAATPQPSEADAEHFIDGNGVTRSGILPDEQEQPSEAAIPYLTGSKK